MYTLAEISIKTESLEDNVIKCLVRTIHMQALNRFREGKRKKI